MNINNICCCRTSNCTGLIFNETTTMLLLLSRTDWISNIRSNMLLRKLSIFNFLENYLSYWGAVVLAISYKGNPFQIIYYLFQQLISRNTQHIRKFTNFTIGFLKTILGISRLLHSNCFWGGERLRRQQITVEKTSLVPTVNKLQKYTNSSCIYIWKRKNDYKTIKI